jgi:hypothetical protein
MDKNSLARFKSEPLDISERAEDLQRVLKIYMTGQKGELGITKISKELGLSRAYVSKLVNEAVIVFRNDDMLRERTKEVVAEYDLTMDNLKSEAYRLLADAEDAGDLKTRATVLKNIGDLEAKRVDTLQKSGLLANMDMAEKVAEQEAKMQAVIQVLKDVVKNDPVLRTEVARRLSVINGQAETVVIQEQ